ncbi:MAG: amidohydrolase, partial [Hyphomicrobiales bacterium]|nr:amidohydrolase [Hyphomicrobiales bacterium]
MSEAPFCPAPDANPHPPHFALPSGATDCHAHVFEAARYGYQSERSYTPPDSTISQLRAMHKTLGIERLVVVAASVHGTNNNPVLDAIATDPKNLRGIATVGGDVTDKELARLHAGGIRGIRVNLVDKGGNPFGS